MVPEVAGSKPVVHPKWVGSNLAVDSSGDPVYSSWLLKMFTIKIRTNSTGLR